MKTDERRKDKIQTVELKKNGSLLFSGVLSPSHGASLIINLSSTDTVIINRVPENLIPLFIVFINSV